MFGKNIDIGKLRLDFYSKNKVKITDDTVPLNNIKDNDNKLFAIAFPFLFVAKLFYNFPPPSGITALEKAFSIIDKRLDPDNFDKCNFSLLELCSQLPLQIVHEQGKGQYIYKAEMKIISFMPRVEVDFTPSDDDDHYHRAAIDTILEWLKTIYINKVGDDVEAIRQFSVIICFWVRAYLKKLIEEGIGDILHSFNVALGASNGMAEQLSKM